VGVLEAYPRGGLGEALPENVPILNLLRVDILKHSETVLESYVVSCGVTDRFLPT